MVAFNANEPNDDRPASQHETICRHRWPSPLDSSMPLKSGGLTTLLRARRPRTPTAGSRVAVAIPWANSDVCYAGLISRVFRRLMDVHLSVPALPSIKFSHVSPDRACSSYASGSGRRRIAAGNPNLETLQTPTVHILILTHSGYRRRLRHAPGSAR